ncbi:MAG: hypothetical protein RB191_24345 [Terriglobia bacterium]|nr:hypothetical protein [Terriglobia bacterium]
MNEETHDLRFNVSSDPMAESPKTTIRWDNGLKGDAQRCAKARGISLAEFVRQSVVHYVAWTAGQDKIQNDDSPQH